MGLYYRYLADEAEPSPSDLTVCIGADWRKNFSQSWLLAVDDIRTLLISSDTVKDIKVEMISWQVTHERVIDVVEASHPLVRAWPAIRPHLHDILEQYPKLDENWCTIDLLRLGFILTLGTLPIVGRRLNNSRLDIEPEWLASQNSQIMATTSTDEVRPLAEKLEAEYQISLEKGRRLHRELCTFAQNDHECGSSKDWYKVTAEKMQTPDDFMLFSWKWTSTSRNLDLLMSKAAGRGANTKSFERSRLCRSLFWIRAWRLRACSTISVTQSHERS